jgi:hypothetical protein
MINQGDIVRSNGRIATQQDGRPRWIEFEGALVLEVEGSDITVSPLGKTAVLICQEDDLHVAKAAQEPDKPGPSLSRLKPAAQPAPAKKAPARRRRRST